MEQLELAILQQLLLRLMLYLNRDVSLGAAPRERHTLRVDVHVLLSGRVIVLRRQIGTRRLDRAH